MIILTSNGLSSDILIEKVKSLLKNAQTAVVITTASEYKEKDWHIPRLKGELERMGLTVEFFDFDCDDTGQLLKYDVVEILGGNPFYLLNAMNKSNCRDVLKKISEERVLIGISAGSIVLQGDIKLVAEYSPEMNEGVGLADLTGLSLTGIQLLPHYDRFLTRFERFEERAREFEDKYKCVVYRINDGEAVIDNGGEYEIIR